MHIDDTVKMKFSTLSKNDLIRNKYTIYMYQKMAELFLEILRKFILHQILWSLLSCLQFSLVFQSSPQPRPSWPLYPPSSSSWACSGNTFPACRDHVTACEYSNTPWAGTSSRRGCRDAGRRPDWCESACADSTWILISFPCHTHRTGIGALPRLAISGRA